MQGGGAALTGEGDAGCTHRFHPGIEVAMDVKSLEGGQGLFAVEGPSQRKHLLSLLDQVNRRPAFEQVSEFAGQFHAGRSCAHDGQGRRGLLVSSPAWSVQAFHKLSQPGDIVEAVEVESVFLHSRNTEIVGL